MKLHHKEEDIASKNKLFGSMEGKKSRYIYRIPYTANIFDVIFTVFNCVQLSTVISLYGLHLIAAQSTAE